MFFKWKIKLTKNADGQNSPESKDNIDYNSSRPSLPGQGYMHYHGPENLWELSVGQGQHPETQVRGCVGHRAKHVFDGMDSLKWIATLLSALD